MKLKEVAVKINEGHVEPNALLAIKRVSETGKITNNFEVLALAKFAQLIQAGKFWNEANPLFTGAVTASPELITAIKQMNAVELVQFAGRIYRDACSKNGACTSAVEGASGMSTTDWLRLYQAREATD